MKTTDAVNCAHAKAWLAKPHDDALRQGHHTAVPAAKKIARQLRKIRWLPERPTERQGDPIAAGARKSREGVTLKRSQRTTGGSR